LYKYSGKKGYITYYSLALISFVLQNNASEEVKTMIMIDHPNLLSAYCSFTEGEALWIVMPYMAGGSCYHLMKSSYPKGFDDENFIAFVLRETLKGLEYLHENGHIHRDVKVWILAAVASLLYMHQLTKFLKNGLYIYLLFKGGVVWVVGF
jgi:serine/threonine protein kinase